MKIQNLLQTTNRFKALNVPIHELAYNKHVGLPKNVSLQSFIFL